MTPEQDREIVYIRKRMKKIPHCTEMMILKEITDYRWQVANPDGADYDDWAEEGIR